MKTTFNAFVTGIIVAVLILAGTALAGYLIGRKAGIVSVKPVPTAVKRDTVYKRDTIRPKPKIITRTIVKTEKFPVKDTVKVKDTVYLPLPRESILYTDSTYRAVVSGIRPSLDSIEVYGTTKVVTEYVETKDPRKVCSISTLINVALISAAAASAATAAAMNNK